MHANIVVCTPGAFVSVPSVCVQGLGYRRACVGSAIGWIAMLCLDTTVFVLTLVKTVQLRHEMRQGLLLILFRDGMCVYT